LKLKGRLSDKVFRDRSDPELKTAPKNLLVAQSRLAAVQLDTDDARKAAFWLEPGFAAGVSPTRPPEPRPSEAETIDVLAVAFVDGVVESICGRRFVSAGKRRIPAEKTLPE
jgi:hypothetical protein